jgi:hypothetical protein
MAMLKLEPRSRTQNGREAVRLDMSSRFGMYFILMATTRLLLRKTFLLDYELVV